LGRLKEITHKAQITINIIKIDKPEIMVNSIEIGVIVLIIISIGIMTKYNEPGKPMEVELGGQSQPSSRRPQAIKINETWANNEGLFVKAKLQNICLGFLIDTGANVTILSKLFIENIEPSLLSVNGLRI
jgi:hypothetical protein